MSRRKKVLIIIPYDEIYPPMNGGMQRCFNVAHQLAKYFDVTAIIHQDKNSFLEAQADYPAVKNISVFSTRDAEPIKDIFNILPGKWKNSIRYRWIKKQYSNSADGSFLRYYSLLKKLLAQHTYDVIVLENLNTVNAVSVIKRFTKTTPVIYDAHNVDSNLAKNDHHQQQLYKVESSLYKEVDMIFTCSEEDKIIFQKINTGQLPVNVIPNGVNIGNLYTNAVLEEIPEYIIFCGALWTGPNREGLLWFSKIWPMVKKSLPYLKLLIVGSGELPDGFDDLKNDHSVYFTGPVDDVKPWYNKAAVSIVPLLSGSGTRLKILEAMSYGLPVLSTSKGAEGIDHTDGLDIAIADDEATFAEALVSILTDRQRRISMSEAARELAEKKYNWDTIGENMAEAINLIPG